MCGIAGIIETKSGKTDEPALRRMNDTLRHRGPDSEGYYVSTEGRAGLAQRRLAIIDLSTAAACPMANEDKSVWITFNGEIYNFRALREELIGRGYAFRTKGDSEVILHGYEEYGAEIIPRLNGMFAFLIWDAKKRTLLAARDHLGVKPLYYSFENGTFLAASEPKAILAHPSFEKTLDEEALPLYLTFGCVPAPRTPFRGMRKLPPATYLTVDAEGRIATKEYWNPVRETRVVPEEEAVAEVRRLLEDAVRLQMVSDVPFGCFLSGGIDSSLNTALMSKALGGPVETFSIGSEKHRSYNEFAYSRRVAADLGAHLHERTVTFADLERFLPAYGRVADDPNADPICFLVYYLSELIRGSGVTVAQVGEGADELFAGYDSYPRMLRFWSGARRIPRSVHSLLAGLARALGLARAAEYGGRLARGESPFWGHATAWTPAEKMHLLTPDFRARIPAGNDYAVIAPHIAAVTERDPAADPLKYMTYLELKVRLGDFLLMRVDKMAMAHSIETRVPYLDHRIVEYALNLPAELKLKGGVTKYVLKQASRGAIPDEIIDRKKQGFGAPLKEWLRDPKTSAVLFRPLRESRIWNLGMLNRHAVEQTIREHERGEDRTFRLWTLVTLALWYDYWFK